MVWFLALRNHGASSNSASSAPAASATPTNSAAIASTQAKSAASSTPVYHGSAPGVQGLTRAIAKAHQAVATSQQNVQRLEKKSAEASSETPAASTTPISKAPSTPVTRSSSTSHPADPPSPTHLRAVGQTPAVKVEGELHQGKTVLLFFWNSRSVDDVAVQKQLQLVRHALGSKISIHQASPSQVGSFGGATQNVRVYETPTILIINRHEQITTLTGFEDAFGITQAVKQARGQTH
jgi:hypothetical protein